jgi:hypothetical protein
MQWLFGKLSRVFKNPAYMGDAQALAMCMWLVWKLRMY